MPHLELLPVIPGLIVHTCDTDQHPKDDDLPHLMDIARQSTKARVRRASAGVDPVLQSPTKA
jgi:hypothetical protein